MYRQYFMPIFWISFSSQNSAIGNVGKPHTHTHLCHSPVCMLYTLRCSVKLFGHVMPAPCFLYSVAIPLFCRRKLIYLSSDILVEYVLMMTTTYLTKTILRTLEDCTICTTVLLLTSKMHKEMNSSLYANTWCAIHMQIQVHTHFHTHTHTKCTHSLSNTISCTLAFHRYILGILPAVPTVYLHSAIYIISLEQLCGAPVSACQGWLFRVQLSSQAHYSSLFFCVRLQNVTTHVNCLPPFIIRPNLHWLKEIF